eukprot:TRINITY_DN64744_c0_g1_i1.p1 TRINITY_DN64744_c0_g1~~TRINITY_DN64744_c0_g1_i1.p1  ORF type:complete len:313 (-),score=58.39 TRINITY_DN64744_c0_g1_i1:88-1026(-)
MANPYGSFQPAAGYIRGAQPDPDAVAAKASFSPGKRKRLNVVAIVINALLPWGVFCLTFYAMGFSIHYNSAALAWGIVGFGFAMAGIAAILAHRASQTDKSPMWYTVAAVTLVIATLLGGYLGNVNYWSNMKSYYDLTNLNVYPAVDPSREKGQQLMDAGRVYFAEGTQIDSSHSIVFRNTDRYCVAPIVSSTEPLASYDFWAVGVNCCSDIPGDFRCGQYSNPHARSGLRLMRDDQRPMFRLAVQQAEAAYNIQAVHPIFFEWLQDPLAEMNTLRAVAFKYFLIGVASHLAFSIVVVVCASMAFAKLGPAF